MDNIITPKLEIAIRPLNASFWLGVASCTAISENTKSMYIFAPYGKVSDRNGSSC